MRGKGKGTDVMWNHLEPAHLLNYDDGGDDSSEEQLLCLQKREL